MCIDGTNYIVSKQRKTKTSTSMRISAADLRQSFSLKCKRYSHSHDAVHGRHIVIGFKS